MTLQVRHCGCTTTGAGHTVHMIQARVFSRCPAEDVHDARVTDVGRNELTVFYDGRQRCAWHSSPAAVARFDRGNILAAYDGDEAVALPRPGTTARAVAPATARRR